MGARRIASGLASLVLVATGCSGDPETPTEAPTQARSSGPTLEERLPDTPVGRVLEETLVALSSPGGLDQEAYERLFAPVFREQVPLSTLAPLAGVPIEVGALRPGQAPNYLTAEARVPGVPRGVLSAALDGSGKLSQFSVAAAPPPTAPVEEALSRWPAVVQRLRSAAPRTAMLVAEVDAQAGECVPARGVRAEQVLPLGSTFKLVLLDALAAAVAEGELAWDDPVVVGEQLKTLPSGVLQDAEGEVELSLLDAAGLMVSLSDNTATDALLQLLGRDVVEERARDLDLPMTTLAPFLSTAELFRLRLEDHPRLAERYQRAGEVERRRTIGGDDVSEQTPPLRAIRRWNDPRWDGEPGWQASAADLCRVVASLAGRDDAALASVMSLNDGGLALDPEQWADVWFKGGSEVGVVTLVHRAVAADGTAYVVAVMAADPAEALPADAASQLLAVSRAALALAVTR